MPTAYTRGMKLDATYWPPGANDGFGGVTFGAPVTIKCAWQEKSDLVRTAEGQEFPSSATVYPDRALEPKGYLALGNYSGIADPKSVTGPRQIISVATSPSLDMTRVLNKVWL